MPKRRGRSRGARAREIIVAQLQGERRHFDAPRLILRHFVVLMVLLVAVPARASCAARSAPHTVALVELYTSERCRTCPPAERWLSGLGSRYTVDRVVPLALHLDTWEYLGGKDPYAERRLSERERRLSRLQRMALVDRPHIVLQGREVRDWGSREFEQAVNRINAQAARALLRVEIRASRPGSLAAVVQAEIGDPAQRMDGALYMAAFQRRMHDYVVLEWQGPFAVQADGRFLQERTLTLLPGAAPDASGVAAFLQNRRTAEVLQAVLLPACSP